MPLRVSATAATLVDGLSFNEWVSLGQRLLRVNEASAWWLGDWLVYGEWCYGEKYRTAISRLDLSYDRLRDYAYVAGNVAAPIRRSDLSFTHHRVVAKLDPDMQREWLARAAANQWTKRQFARMLLESTGSSQCLRRERLQVAVDEGRLGRWERAAGVVASDLREWVIETLDRAAADTLADTPRRGDQRTGLPVAPRSLVA